MIGDNKKSGASPITRDEERLDKRARKGKEIQECYLCGCQINLKSVYSRYLCDRCNEEPIIDDYSENGDAW